MSSVIDIVSIDISQPYGGTYYDFVAADNKGKYLAFRIAIVDFGMYLHEFNKSRSAAVKTELISKGSETYVSKVDGVWDIIHLLPKKYNVICDV